MVSPIKICKEECDSGEEDLRQEEEKQISTIVESDYSGSGQSLVGSEVCPATANETTSLKLTRKKSYVTEIKQNTKKIGKMSGDNRNAYVMAEILEARKEFEIKMGYLYGLIQDI